MSANNGKTTIKPGDKLLLTATEVGQLIGCTREMVYCLVNEAKIPKAVVRLSERFVRWRRKELEAWISAGAPSPRHWTWRETHLPNTEMLLRRAMLAFEQKRKDIILFDDQIAKQQRKLESGRRALIELTREINMVGGR